MNKTTVKIIGAGLAGSEATWYLAQRGIKVILYEMRPEKLTPAHKTGYFSELVCSNSFRSDSEISAPGILKREMRMMHSITMEAAEKFRVPAGQSLAVDREKFSSYITEKISAFENVEVIREEVTEIPDPPVIIATGPLTSDNLINALKPLIGENFLYFYDAIAPIVDADSIDMSRAFWANRYDKGDTSDYLNCPMTEEEYKKFVEELLKAEKVPYHEFESAKHFEGCLPIEEMAARGVDVLAHGPMKPVGLIDPKTGKRPYAVVQLRKENREGTAFNLVGFQTKLTYREQERVFRLIPCLKNAEFLRFGSMHRNTYINAPEVLDKFLRIKNTDIMLAGQITGVEGYIESATTGIIAGYYTAKLYFKNSEPLIPPSTTATGALLAHLRRKQPDFQPSNINFSLFDPLPGRIKNKKKKRELYSQRALKDFKRWLELSDFLDGT